MNQCLHTGTIESIFIPISTFTSMELSYPLLPDTGCSTLSHLHLIPIPVLYGSFIHCVLHHLIPLAWHFPLSDPIPRKCTHFQMLRCHLFVMYPLSSTTWGSWKLLTHFHVSCILIIIHLESREGKGKSTVIYPSNKLFSICFHFFCFISMLI